MRLRIDSRTILYLILVATGACGFLFTFFFPQPHGFYAFIIVAALAGLGVALTIHDTKRSGKQLVCPTGSDCNAVVNSRYSKFFGISLEYWGMGYFTLISLAYLALIFMPELFTPGIMFALVVLSLCAGLFSVYLLFVQAFLLHQWCIWCILTAMLSMMIAVTSLISAEVAVSFLLSIAGVLEMFKFFGFSLGVGGVTAAVFLFFHFLEDASIDNKELNVIKGISELVWVGFGIVLVSQFAYYISHPEMLAASGAFLAQIISLLVFAIAGAALMIIYTPFLVYMPFERITAGDNKASFASLRRPTAIIGSIALFSWYFAFVMNFVELSVTSLLTIFAVILGFVAFLAMLWDKSLHTRSPSR